MCTGVLIWHLVLRIIVIKSGEFWIVYLMLEGSDVEEEKGILENEIGI